MKVTNENKASEQALVLQKWNENGGKGTWIAFTGVGKTRVGTIVHRPNEKGLVIVPTENLRDREWEQSFLDWSHPSIRESVEIVCIQTAYKWTGRHYDTVVVDEVHTALSEQYKLFFENNTFDRILCLTATEPENDEKINFLFKMAPVVWRTPRERAIKLKLVSDSMVFNLGIQLTPAEREYYDRINGQFKFYENELGGPRSAFSRSGSFLKFQKIAKDGSNVRVYIPENRVIWMSQIDTVTILENQCRPLSGDELVLFKKRIHQSRMYWEHLRQRKEACQRAIGKQEIAKKIYDRYNERRAIIFSPSVDIANAIAERLGDSCAPYHSKLGKELRKTNLLAFSEGNKRSISSVKALNAGMDVPDCDLAINLTNDSKQLQQIQKNGRASRFKEGKIAYFINIYALETQEAVWLSRGTMLMNPKWITNIDELPLT